MSSEDFAIRRIDVGDGVYIRVPHSDAPAQILAGRTDEALPPATAVVKRGSPGRVVCERCRVADRPHTRLRGLLGRQELPPGEGLLLRPAPSIHTWFMRFPIDVVFMDADLRVLDVIASMRPWGLTARPRARVVLELASGEGSRRDVRRGDVLELVAGSGARAG